MLGFLISPWAKIKAFGAAALALAGLVFWQRFKARGRKIKGLKKDIRKHKAKDNIAKKDALIDHETKDSVEKVGGMTDEELRDSFDN